MKAPKFQSLTKFLQKKKYSLKLIKELLNNKNDKLPAICVVYQGEFLEIFDHPTSFSSK